MARPDNMPSGYVVRDGEREALAGSGGTGRCDAGVLSAGSRQA